MPTNREGEDLTHPLPGEWTLEALRRMPVTLYGMRVSPPSCKVRFLLMFYRVPFKAVDGKKRGSDYRKLPVLDVGDRQINDSHIIVKNLAPILQGRPLTAEELELERSLTYGLMIELERSTAVSARDLDRCGRLEGGIRGLALRALAPCIACCRGPCIGRDKGLRSLEEYREALQGHLTTEFFGGHQPGVIDAAVYGTLAPFEAAQVPAVESLLGSGDSPLRAWHQRMAARATGVHIF